MHTYIYALRRIRTRVPSISVGEECSYLRSRGQVIDIIYVYASSDEYLLNVSDFIILLCTYM
jgi:hypothetical protein